MGLRSENVELQSKIVKGVNRAYKKLLIDSAEKKQNLVIADEHGNVVYVPAIELLEKLNHNGQV